MPSGPEKRRDPRIPLILRVEYPGQERLVRDTTENLSAGGLFIRTERAFQVGQRVPLQISFPNLLPPEEVEVEVVRVRWNGPEGPAGVAVQVPPDRIEDRLLLSRIADTAWAAEMPDLTGRTFQVLVVEDNHHVVEMYEYALRRLRTSSGQVRMAVRFAENGQEALAAAATTRPDLVIADLYMPVMDGFSLVEQLRADRGLAGLPILVISGGGDEARRRALELGVDVFLQKPVQFADILGTVRSLLQLAP